MRVSSKVVWVLVLLLVLFATQYGASLPSGRVNMTPIVIYQQSASTTPYMAVFKLETSGLNSVPFVVYPVSSRTVWVYAVHLGPFLSQLINFTVGASPQIVLNTTASLSSIIADKQGKVWIASDPLSYYDTVTRKEYNVTAFARGSSPQYMAIDTTNHLWLTLLGSYRIGMYNLSTKENATYPVPTSGATLQGITVARNGTIWFAEAAAKKLGRLDPSSCNASSCKIDEYTPPSSVKLLAPVQVAVDDAGVVWFTDHGSNEFGSFNPKTGDWTQYPIGYCPGIACSIGLPNAISLDQNGNVWFSEHIAGRIAKYDPVSGLLTEYIIPAPPGISDSGFAYAWWASPGPGNLIWFTAFGYGEIGYVNASVPVPFTVSVVRGLTIRTGTAGPLSVTINDQGQRTVSVGVATSQADVNYGGDPFVSGPVIQNLQVATATTQVGTSIIAAWNAPTGSRFVTATVSDGQVSVGIPIKVDIVQSTVPYLTGTTAGILIAGEALQLYRHRKRKNGSSPSEAPPDSIQPEVGVRTC